MKKKVKKKVGQKRSSIFFIVFSIIVLLIIGFLFVTKPSSSECANSISCIADLSGKFQEGQTKGEFMGKTVSVPPETLSRTFQQPVLGENTPSNKHIYIDLTTQHLYAKEGDSVIYEFPISSGRTGITPTGDFRFWIKLRYTRMIGGSKENRTYYNVPNVPYTMYFYNNEIPKWRGYGVHGAYWHNNFGHPMSHGCVNLRPEDAEKLYYWTDPSPSGYTTYIKDGESTPLTIYGTTPRS